MEIKQVCEVFDKLSNLKTDKEKIQVLQENDCGELRYLLELAYDPHIHLGIKDINPIVSLRITPTFGVIKKLVEDLAEGKYIGNQAKSLLEETISCNEEIVVRYLTDVFQKNLRIGCGIKTINKVFFGLISEFEIALCNVLQSSEKENMEKKNYDVSLKDFEEQLKEGDWVVEAKMDGLRCITIIDSKGNINFISRGGKEIYNLNHIEEELKSMGLKNVVLDGEMMGRNWNESISIAHSEKNTKGKNLTNMKYYVFDVLTMEDWVEKNSSCSYIERIQDLQNSFKNFKYIVGVPWKKVNTLIEAKAIFEEYLEQGFEGVVFKNMNSKYSFKRSNEWLKWKPFYSVDLVITGYEEGENKNKGRLGKFYVDYNGVKVGVGGGYSEKEPNNQRRIFWEKREEMIGKIIEVKHYGITSEGSLKYPVFLRVRKDKE